MTSRCTVSAWQFPSAKSLAETAVGEIMKIGGWKTESIAKYSVGAASSEQVHDSKKKNLGLSYADASELPLSPEVQKDYTACAQKELISCEERLSEPILRLASC